MSSNYGYTCIDMKAIEAKVKSSKGTEDEPFEGEVPIAEVEAVVAQMLKAGGGATKQKFIFDGYIHASADKFLEFIEKFGSPSFCLNLTVSDTFMFKRWSSKNEDAEFDQGEENIAAMKATAQADLESRTIITGALSKTGRVNCIDLNTSASLETTKKMLKTKFSPKVIIVNHEKRLGVDVTCANIAIKFNLLYISVYQLIRQHIEGKTEWGSKLLSTKRYKEIALTTQVRDEFNEAEFSAVHFNQKVVMDLINHTIAEHRTSQKYIILEGLCNSSKLTNEADKFELRL